MCGIAGIFNYAEPDLPVDRDLLVRMTRTLAHRGPDAEDFFFSGNIGFGHRRLSIVDLSPTGAQPMQTEDGACCITYNGEFYNHGEFRARLSSEGCRFRGTSDTETLLRLMDRKGPDALATTAGIFGFGFWDGRKQTLTLARDPLGVKQIYFHDNGRRIVFASEIKALLEDPDVPREADPEAINQYLHFHTPLFDRTFFRGIRQLRAGEYMQVTRYGSRLVTYWRLQDFEKVPGTDAALVEDLRERLTGIVSQQLMSDVPVGSFFSGGIDSSAIAAFASQSGSKPVCFGVHFSGQGVTDERPYQEAAAKALGLDLRLITMDGSTFPEDFRHLMYHQDQPVIGSAMFPMSRVSRLAAGSVKVCLGGQAADEIFGGYARYALGQPARVLRSWFSSRLHRAAPSGPNTDAKVGSNLSRQVAERKTLHRLARNARHLLSWETSYFEHFAKVPEQSWLDVVSGPEFCSRQRCRQLFHEVVARSPATRPMDKIMHWDLQTYLTGLFHQDDRMSMASSLESRVPFADPRLVQFAFKVDPNLRFRGGASKWLLRKAVSNVLPSVVLSRRKVGFDTPAEAWMAQHEDFVRDTLLSRRSLERGFWNRAGLESLLHSKHFDVLWKTLSIELWASVFLDAPPVYRSPERYPAEVKSSAATAGARPTEKLRYLAREVIELGAKGTAARVKWELKTRSGMTRLAKSGAHQHADLPDLLNPDGCRLPFTDPDEVSRVLPDLMSAADADQLLFLAREATRGRILCFSRWMADFGNPVDWHRDPANEHRWHSDAHWAEAIRGAGPQTDVKFTWEAARFPQAYLFARAAVIEPSAAPVVATAFDDQVLAFIERNPPGAGLHWFSGQEIALRMLAWLFGLHVFSALGLASDSLKASIARHLAASTAHIARQIEYARDSVYNNHLLTEALGLFVGGSLLPGTEAKSWRQTGFDLLVQQAGRQVYPDGGHIQLSHNYHRVAMQVYLWATAFVRANRETAPHEWIGCMERSLDFLLAHQNDGDGRLPNFGANDGSNPIALAGTQFSDFRPVLQALSVATRNERIYPAGPWDEMSIWLSGTHIADLPIRPVSRRSTSYSFTGHHVLRGAAQGTFCTFRCGSVLDRFAQIDMLHVDVWWRGENVLTDPGTYLYNSIPEWHDYFMRTGSHNTVRIDGCEQMPHVRRFKTLYPTSARLLGFEDTPEWTTCAGEHYGYLRSANCVHRRSVLFVKREEVWVVVDTVSGEGTHEGRLHWTAGDYPYAFDVEQSRLTLETPCGEFCIAVLDKNGLPHDRVDVVTGSEDPPRGWLSRHYGEKVRVPSIAAVATGSLPITFVTVASCGRASIDVSGEEWTIAVNNEAVQFRLDAGAIADIRFTGKTIPELRS